MDTHPVSETCSRKTFFAKLAGFAVATGMVSFLSAKTKDTSSTTVANAPVNLRPETRAVPRQAGTV
jgi:hypothetical protein